MQNNNYLNLLGLAYRARKCVLGEDKIVQTIQTKQAKLILLATDIGKQTEKKLKDKATFYNIPFRKVDDRVTIGQALGKDSRVAVSIIDDGFANKLLEWIDSI